MAKPKGFYKDKDKTTHPVFDSKGHIPPMSQGVQTLQMPKRSQVTVPEPAVREMELWLDNTYELYQRKEAWTLNYARKMNKGKYNRQKALEGIANNLVPEVIKDYRKNNGDFMDVGEGRSYYLGRVSKADKMAMARPMLESIEEEAEWKIKNDPESLKIQRG